MGQTLTGQIVAETYDALIKVTDNNTITGTKKRMTDGVGNDTPLLISSTDVQVDGNFLTESTQFNTATAQTADTVGKLVWNDQDGTLDLRLKGGNVTLQIGQEQLARVVNKTGVNLLESEYKVVKVDGAQGQRLKVALAQANNDANSAETLGVVTENINDNQEGFITTSGLVRGINTTGSLQGETWADGDMLYLSGTTPGQLTKVKPSAPTHTVIVGYVVYAHITQGAIYVKVDNGYELDELHNVLITTPSDGQVLSYESSTGLWKNTTNGNIGGTGTTNTVPKFTSTSAIGNSNITDSGSLITLGSNSYVNGKLGVATSSLSGNSIISTANVEGGWLGVGNWGMGISSNVTFISSVTGRASSFISNSYTQATAFTLGDYIGFYARNIGVGAGSSVTTQTGFGAVDLTGATTNYGFRGQLSSGTGKWNLYMDGTANNYLAGALNIGTTTVSNPNLRIGRAITGSTTVRSIYQESIVQSDVTSTAAYNTTYAGTQATAFTLTNLYHYDAVQGIIGAGSTVTNQVGYRVDASLNGATNNYAFQGNIASGTGRWNIYMQGTANNYLAGSLGIGTTSLTGYNVGIGKSITGAVQAFGIYQTSDILADVTTSAWAFATNLGTAASTISGEIVHYRAASKAFGAGSTITNQFAFAANSSISGATNNYAFYSSIASGTGRWGVYMAGTATNYLAGVLTIGTTSPSASALVQMNSTTQGFLPPRMTSAQRTAIASPAIGLIVYQTDSIEGAYVYKSSGWALMA